MLVRAVSRRAGRSPILPHLSDKDPSCSTWAYRWCRNQSTGTSTPSATPAASSGTKSVDKSREVKKTSVVDGDTLPTLQRPLGVPESPSTYRKTFKDRVEELMDQDVRIAQRRHIIKEASKGYYSDLNATRRHGGKTWIAPKTLIREESSLYFPDVSGTALSNSEKVHTTNLCKGKVSVVAILTSAMSEVHVDSFVKPTNEEFLCDPHYQFVQINLQENIMKAYLVSLYTSSLRRKVSKELQSTYILSSQNLEYEREPLGLNNKHIGFVYLLDPNLRIRWAGGGLATPEETESLRNCVRVLLRRFKSSSG